MAHKDETLVFDGNSANPTSYNGIIPNFLPVGRAPTNISPISTEITNFCRFLSNGNVIIPNFLPL